MNSYEEKLKTYLRENDIEAEHLTFTESCHSVEDAAKAVKASADDFVKNICMICSDGSLITAIVKGEDRVSISLVEKALKLNSLRMAKPEEILEKTAYICGGTPSFGYKAIFLIDDRVMEKEFVFTGGGSENSLLRISTKALQKANEAAVLRIRK